jgi:hypothetical protein
VSSNFILAAQVDIRRATIDRHGIAATLQAIQKAANVGSLDILVVGGDEIPSLYQTLTRDPRPIAGQVFLWYPVLADYPNWKSTHRMLNLQGVPTQGLSNELANESVDEKFQFSCPNNPEVRSVIAQNLERLFGNYPFDGVFIDKIRYPSPANGLAEMMSCFCPHCREKARSIDLDLDEVRNTLDNFPWQSETRENHSPISTASSAWLQAFARRSSLLARFLQFRADSITALVKDIASLVHRFDRQLALDLFSPSLGLLVGQDYTTLAGHAAWCKPMVYRYAKGPAGLRLEIPRLVEDLAAYTGMQPEQVWLEALKFLPGGSNDNLEHISQEGVPFELIESEAREAVRWFAPKPVYLGVEAVSLAAFQIDVTPDYVSKAVKLARESGASGVVLSWDLLSMPAENIRTARMAADHSD